VNAKRTTGQHRNWKTSFFTIWTGQQLSWVGSAVAGFALVWWLTETTGSATVLAMGTLITLLPGVLLGPLVGALVDRWNRKVVMLVADSIIALFSAWLAYLFWTGQVEIWHVYIIMLVRAIGGAFHFPAMQASTSLMVPEEHLPRVAGINQMIGGAVSIVSPPLGALLLSILPLHAIMGIDVITAAFAIVPLALTHIPQPRQTAAPDATAGDRPSLWVDVREGLRYVVSWPGLLAVCATAMVINFLVHPAMSLLPILITKQFGGEAIQLGWMNSAWGVGLVVGGLILGAWGGFRRRIATVLMGTLGLGVGLLLIGLAPGTAFPLALAGMFLAAALNSMSSGSAVALLQQIVAPEMQGRVFTLITSLTTGIAPLGMAIAGPVADALGVRTWFLMGGIASVAMAIVGVLTPSIMHLEDNHRAQVPTTGTNPAAIRVEAGVGAE
jgi:DHA3 family macrolide efflux protein-like MFS transporter